jgi:cob(I)alamin adenosyltransferase
VPEKPLQEERQGLRQDKHAGGLSRGLVQVYTGPGKGKTTAAFGLAMRAAGRGLTVKVIQLLKGRESGEVLAARRLGIDVEQFGTPEWADLKSPSQADRDRAGAALVAAGEALSRVDLLILDEANVALAAGLLQLDDVLAMLSARPPSVEVVLTGRGAPPGLIDRADLVTEMREVKHPYAAGLAAREGIEF